MTTVILILLFFAGVCISVQSIAALFGIIDLWYTITIVTVRVARRILVWCGIVIVISWFLKDHYRNAFLLGLAVYVLFFIGTFVLQQVLIKRNMRLLKDE